VCAYVHKGECSYVYEYLRLYYISKKIIFTFYCVFFCSSTRSELLPVLFSAVTLSGSCAHVPVEELVLLAFRIIGLSISFCRSARCLTRRCRGLSNLRQIRVGSRPLPAWIPRPRTALRCSVLFDSAQVFGLGFHEPVQALISCR
jgi:hypothetical protein